MNGGRRSRSMAFGARNGVIAAILLSLSGCGYHIGGQADMIPKTVKTIAVPAFINVTTRYKLARLLPEDITREFLSRTRFVIVPDPNQADAVLGGTLANFVAYPVVSDPKTARATAAEVVVTLNLTLRERASGKVLWSQSAAEFRQRYEISLDPKTYFDESGTAVDRVSRDVARTVVSAILEGF